MRIDPRDISDFISHTAIIVMLVGLLVWGVSMASDAPEKRFREAYATKALGKHLSRAGYSSEDIDKYQALPIVIVPYDYKSGLIIITEDYGTAYVVYDTTIELYNNRTKKETSE